MDATDESASLIDWNTPLTSTISKPLIPLPSFDGNFEINEDNPFDYVERQIHDVFSPNVSVIAGNRDDNFLDSLIGRMEKMRLTNTSVVEASSNVSHNETIEKINSKSSSPLLTMTTDNSTSSSSPWDISNLLKMRSKVANFMNQVVEDRHSINQSLSNCHNNLVSLSQEDDSKDKALNNGFVMSTTDESHSSSSSKIRTSSEISRFCEECLLGQSFEDIRSIVPCWEEMTYYSSSDEENESVLNFNTYSENSQTRLSRERAPLQVEAMQKLRAPLVFQEPNIRVKKTNHATKQGPLKAVVPIASMKGVSQKDSPSITNKKSVSQLKMRRRSAPVATSTPQSVRGVSLNSSLSTPVKYSNTSKSIQSRAPSPDSTSGLKCRSKNGIQSKLTTKSRRIPCSPVSSSTNLSFPRSVSKTTRIMKNLNFTELSKGAIMKSRSIHNKENLSPFQT